MQMEGGNLREDKVTVKHFLKAIVCFNGEVMTRDNVINPVWIMTSWKTTWNLTWIEKINSIDCIVPSGFRDWVPKELQRVGCVELLNTVQRRVRPKLHVFGGIHEGKEQYYSLLHLRFQEAHFDGVLQRIMVYWIKVGREFREVVACTALCKFIPELKQTVSGMCATFSHLHLSLCKGCSIQVTWKQFKFWQTWLEKQMRFPTLASQNENYPHYSKHRS